ncbi:hypothetical protein [Isoptericola dokdonensis]|jgi:hypothetical protein|uniref:Uncharacterized protein n=1 Tax=Isoptericola dokdonensis DS-3 TaxID=1300344 RepID=A0A168EB67_9MICO|nr:hypothetical protein [Isoptericola dokdonensis]ANC29828.1 hypothetical protein I598_0237 [Isoptericola dokdonensis DS-3]
MDHWEHLTDHRLREAELVARAEQVRRARERLAADRPAVPVLAGARARWSRLLDALRPGATHRTA